MGGDFDSSNSDSRLTNRVLSFSVGASVEPVRRIRPGEGTRNSPRCVVGRLLQIDGRTMSASVPFGRDLEVVAVHRELREAECPVGRICLCQTVAGHPAPTQTKCGTNRGSGVGENLASQGAIRKVARWHDNFHDLGRR
jgi:hypothetical protein